MAQVAELVAKLRLDSSDFQRGMAQAQRTASTTGASMRRSGMVMSAGVTLPLAAAGVAAVRWASDAEEARNKVRVVFGDQARIVERWSEDAAESMGLSSAAALDAAGTFGNFFDGMGLAAGPAREMSTSLVQLAGDLASFNNADPSEMLMALRAGMAGETEPLRRFGVNMTEASLAAYAMEQGITQSVSSMTDAQKAQLRYSFILDRTGNAQGDFARTADGTANSMRTLWAQVQDLGASFGQILLPAVTAAMNWLKGLFDRILTLSPGMRTLVLAIAGVAAAIGPLLWVGGALLGVFGAISLPVVAVVGALALLVGGLVLAYQRSEKFRDVVQGVWEWLKEAGAWLRANFVPMVVEAFGALVRWVQGPFADGFTSALETVIDAVSYVVDWVRQNWPAIQETIQSVMNGVRAVIGTVIAWVTQAWRTWGGTILAYVSRTWDAISQYINGALNLVMGVIRTVMAVIRGDWSGAWDGIKQAFAGVWQMIQGIVRQALNVVRTLLEVTWRAVAGIFDGVWNGIVSAFRGYWNLIKTIVMTYVNAVKSAVTGAWNNIKSATTTQWNAIKAAVSAVWNAIKSTITTALNAAKSAISGAWASVRNTTSTAWNGIRSMIGDRIDGIVDFFRRLPGRLASAGSGVFNFLKEQFRSVLNTIIGWWNNFGIHFDGYDIPGPGPNIPGFNIDFPNITPLAKGGPATGGKPYLVGEKGPELFVPGKSGKVVPNDRLGAGAGMAPLDPKGELKKFAKTVKTTSKDIDKTWGQSTKDFTDKTKTGHLAAAEAAKKGMADQTAAITSGGRNITTSWSRSMTAVTASTRTGWTNARTATNTGMNDVAARVRTGTAAINTAMRTGATGLNTTWRRGLEDVRQTTWTGLTGSNSVKSKTHDAVQAIGTTWEPIKSKFRNPLNTVVTGVVNRFLNGLRPIARSVEVGIPGNMRELPTFHSGGVVGGAGEVLAVLQSGEVVLDRSTVRALSGERGGSRRTGDGPGSAALPGVLGRIAQAASGFKGNYDGIQRMLTTMEGTMRRASAFSSTKMSGKIGDGLAQPLADAVSRAIPALRNAFVPPVHTGMGWEAMWDVVQRKFPWAQLFSGFRPGAITATGNASYHGMGRAIDISPSLEIFNWLHDSFMAQTKELIFSIPAAASRNIHNGQHHPYGEPTFSDHFDHIHWAVAKGMDAVVKRPTAFLAGEAGAERVTVRPYNGPGAGQGGGDGVVNHFHVAGFIDRDTVEEITRSQEWSRRKARL